MRVSSLNCIARYCIEFSSLILLLVILLLMYGMGDATFAKQVKISNPKNANSLNDKTLNIDNLETNRYENNENDKIFEDVLRFTPGSIDFGKTEIGKPVIETVQVHNTHNEKSINMISVTGISPFYCSLIEEIILAPRSNTTFTVAFLAKQEGLVNNTLLVHSNIGLSRLKLFGFGKPSQFRIQPLIGAKISVNSTYSSVIYLYNPFPTSIQLTQVYSSGTNLQLELLDQENNNNKLYDGSIKYWNIPPYEYRPVMRTNFAAKTVSNYTSFIRIHLNSSEQTQLLLPIEIEVLQEPGLYTTVSVLDFGTRIPKSIHFSYAPSCPKIELINTHNRSITVDSIEFGNNISHGLEIIFDGPVTVAPNLSKPLHLAKICFLKNSCIGRCSGTVIIHTQEDDIKPIKLDYIMNVLEGDLFLSERNRTFFYDQYFPSKLSNNDRPLEVTNQFDFPIVIKSVILDLKIIQIELSKELSTQKEIFLKPGERFLIGSASIASFNMESPSVIQQTSSVIVKTNLTAFYYPLIFSANCFKFFVYGEREPLRGTWDIGVMSSNETITTYFILFNSQFTSLQIRSWGSLNDHISVDYSGSVLNFHEPSSLVNKSLRELKSYFYKNFINPKLPEFQVLTTYPSFFSVFRVHLKQTYKGEHSSTIYVDTNFGQIELPVKYIVNDGKIIATKAVLLKTFPGRVVSTQINIRSYYSSPVRVKRILLESNDKRFKVDIPPGYVIQPGDNYDVKVTFDPGAICPPLVCYASLDIEKEVGHFWLLSHSSNSDIAFIDKELYKLVRNQWMTHSEHDLAPIASFRFHTDGFGSFRSEVQAQLHWPRLSNKFALKFSPLRLGRSSVKYIVIENPADKPIIVQTVHIANYHNANVLIQMMQSIIFHKQWATSDIETMEKTILDPINLAAFGFATSSAQGFKLTDTNRIYDWLGVKPSPESFTMLLAPGARQRLGVVFKPLAERNFTSLLVLRNNLTVIEVVVLRGEGGSGLLKIDQNRPTNVRTASAATPLRVSSFSSSSSSPSLSSVDYSKRESSKIIFEFTETTLDRLCLASRGDSLQNYDESTNAFNGHSSTTEKKSKDDEKAEADDNEENDNENNSNSDPVIKNKFVIRHRFQAINVGRMGLQIRHFFIDSMPCEGYGFQIKNCRAVQLQPNQSFDLEMTYSPDFTQTTVKHNLYVLLDDDFTQWQKFELVAKIPANYLSSCLAALPRPPWEIYVGRCLFLITTFLIILAVFVAYTDATKLVSGYAFSISDADSNNDEDFHSIDDDDVKPISNGHSNINGVISNVNKQQNVKIKQRKNAKSSQQIKKTFSDTLTNVGESRFVIKSHSKNVDVKDKLNHRNSSSSENESFGNSAPSEGNSSNHQSTESLCDISVESRKNSIDEQRHQSNVTNKDRSSQENSKKKKNKIESKKLNISGPRNTNESTQSLYFPPIEEFTSIIKTRSATHPGQKSKLDDKKKKSEVKSIENVKSMPKKNDKSSLDHAKEPAKNAWNIDQNFLDIWKQPADLSNDILRLPENSAKKFEHKALSKSKHKWNIGEWSNDIICLPQEKNSNPNLHQQSKSEQSLPGYFGLRFDSNKQSPSFMSTIASNNKSSIDRLTNSWQQSHASLNENNFFCQWDPRGTPSPRIPTSSVPFSPVIAPPKSTSPSNTVQQIKQQDKYFQQRSLASNHTQFVDSRFDFQGLIGRSPPFIDQSYPNARIPPPPGFSELSSRNVNVDNSFNSWFSEISPTRSTTDPVPHTDLFNHVSNSIWNSFESNFDCWPNRITPTPDMNEGLWRNEKENFFGNCTNLDLWTTFNSGQSSTDLTWSFPPFTSEHQTQYLDSSPYSPNPQPLPPSSSSSSSSNGRNNNN